MNSRGLTFFRGRLLKFCDVLHKLSEVGLDVGQGFALFRLARLLCGFFRFLFLRNFLDILADFLDVLLKFSDVFLNFTDVYLHFFDVLTNLAELLRRVVYRHLNKNREIDRLERDDDGEDAEHIFERDPVFSRSDEEADEDERVHDDRRRGADPARDADSCFPDVIRIFHTVFALVGSILPHCYNQAMKTRLVGNTHLVAGGPEMLPDILAFLENEDIKTKGNPDLYVRAYKHFGIDEARELRDRVSLRPLGERRVFVIAAPDMNREAQNALLKTLEEAPGNALFFFIVPSPNILLPTLRSRANILPLCIPGMHKEAVDVAGFIKATPQKRLEMLKPLLEKDVDDRRDLGTILSFLSSLERSLAESPKGLRAIYRARKYITDRGALVKPLLEQIALLVPRV